MCVKAEGKYLEGYHTQVSDNVFFFIESVSLFNCQTSYTTLCETFIIFIVTRNPENHILLKILIFIIPLKKYFYHPSNATFP
jgi:hypothetical protein